MEEQDVIDLLDKLQSLDIKIWIDGGWAVDALLGKQTRFHKDLDIVIQQKDVAVLRQFLEARGYSEVKVDIARPHNFVLADEREHEIDVHAIVFNDKGDGIYGPIENNEEYPAASLSGHGKIGNLDVSCITPEYVVKFHRGYALTRTDYEDVLAICERFNLMIPDEYLSKKTFK